MAESSPNWLKTPWEKEKLLVPSNFSFSHRIFKRLVLQIRKNQGLFGKGLRLVLTKRGLCTLMIHFTSQLLRYLWIEKNLHQSINLKYAGKEFLLKRVSNSKPQDHDSDTLPRSHLGWAYYP